MNRSVYEQTLDWLIRACSAFLSRTDTLEFDADREALPTLAPAHQLEPMLHSLFAGGRITGAVPDDLREAWLAAYLATLLRNRRRFDLLQGIVTACERNGLPVLVVKGPVHARRVWGDDGLRQMIDMDLLCRENQLPAMTDVLKREGFEALGKTSPFHLEFRHTRTGDRIELHFDVYEVFANRDDFLEQLWSSAEVLDDERLRIPAPSPAACRVFDLGHLLHNDLRVNMRTLMDFAAQVNDAAVQNLLTLVDLEEEHHQVLALTDALGWTARGNDSVRDAQLFDQLRDYWTGLPDDPGPGALREMLYHPGVMAKLRKGFEAVFPPGELLRQNAPDQPVPMLRARHAWHMVSGVLSDFFGAPGLNRPPARSLKRDIYRRRQ